MRADASRRIPRWVLAPGLNEETRLLSLANYSMFTMAAAALIEPSWCMSCEGHTRTHTHAHSECLHTLQRSGLVCWRDNETNNYLVAASQTWEAATAADTSNQHHRSRYWSRGALPVSASSVIIGDSGQKMLKRVARWACKKCRQRQKHLGMSSRTSASFPWDWICLHFPQGLGFVFNFSYF